MKIRFYTKKGCHLCDKTERYLLYLIRNSSVEVYKTDIESDSEALDRYHDMIPVIEFPDGKILWGRITGEEIERALSSYKSISPTKDRGLPM
ncbi:hypothetical protein BMS3Bbin06_01402 [bacterium BMS3Bbin06]|nr:hypothetical protein BMS3Abin08_01823 [bacterium BMS3Abin08]GBE34868.1 hypothetical protein BMS3Bbin06_01402 [bacterium BMS3Bbin06]